VGVGGWGGGDTSSPGSDIRCVNSVISCDSRCKMFPSSFDLFSLWGGGGGGVEGGDWPDRSNPLGSVRNKTGPTLDSWSGADIDSYKYYARQFFILFFKRGSSRTVCTARGGRILAGPSAVPEHHHTEI
jgi:hypothetical protein